jgi:hypothetical protein
MYYLIYLSTAVKSITQSDLTSILEKSRVYNLEEQITGLLLYAEGTFIQVLEGDKKNVLNIFSKIIEDKRHKNIIQLISDDIDERVFPNWLMGFSALDPGKMAELKGYIDPKKDQLFKNDLENPVMMMIKTFVDSNKFGVDY